MAPVYTLLDATRKNNLPLFNQLIQKENIDVNQQDKDGFTPLIYASLRSNKEMVKSLIQRNADLNKGNLNGDGPLMWAILSNCQLVAKMLIMAGADVNQRNIQGETPLMAAAFNGDGVLVYLMLEKGADASIQDRSGQRASDKAMKKGYSLIANRLKCLETTKKISSQKKRIVLKKILHREERDN